MAVARYRPPDISICIPTYNRAALLRRCLSHLLTFRAITYEVIVGDNASSDATPDVAAEFAAKFPYWSYFRHAENVGVTRNYHSILGARGRPMRTC